VLFWNPGCGFCRQMLPDVKEWEARAPEGAPRLLVVSAGSEEANKEMGLTSRCSWTSNSRPGEPSGLLARPLRCSWTRRAS
jgi:thiol-disulfide isomerase/thioredoxin